jgi:hypothetical protein
VLKKPYLDSFIWIPLRDIFSAAVKNSEAQCVGSLFEENTTVNYSEAWLSGLLLALKKAVVLYSEVWLSGLLLVEICHCEKQ